MSVPYLLIPLFVVVLLDAWITNYQLPNVGKH
jgi:hypothetical protein